MYVIHDDIAMFSMLYCFFKLLRKGSGLYCCRSRKIFFPLLVCLLLYEW